ncbi:MAG: HDIG domain-containing protein [Bacteroidaceae bacterium]|nr:HDIG domain-containing protein [Bacteroidaceae bacterium]
MSRYNKPVIHNWREILLQALVAAAFIAVVVWFQPRGSRSLMHFDVGRPWPYGQLIAPFDFPIFKSDAQLAHERDSVRLLYEPYFEFQEQVEAEQIKALRLALREQTSAEIPLSYRTYIERRLHEIYQIGILSADDYQRLRADSCQNIRIFTGTEATSHAVWKLLSPRAAYDYLFANIDSFGLSRQKFMRLSMNQFIVPNLSYDQTKSESQWNELLGSLSPSSGMVLVGQSIIDRGNIVTERDAQILSSYERAAAARSNTSRENSMIVIGHILYVAVIVICLFFYFNLFRRDYISNGRSVLLLFLLMLVYPALTTFLVRHTLLSVYLIPYVMLPVFIRVFMDSRTAFFTHVCMVLLCAVSLRYPFEFIATQLTGGLVAIYTLRELSERSQIFRTAIFSTATMLVVYASLDFIHGRQLMGDTSLTRVDFSIYQHIIISGVLVVFAYPLMYLIERLFNFTSNVTLVELSNVNRSLLRRLSEVAPGTFQHSMQVANLAAEVALKIGAKSQLVRTGALYHDIGKMQNAAFFTENQAGGINPHDKLDARESARVIISHVADGEALADRNKLPRLIRDFISTHHGKGLVKYFYITYKNQHPDEVIDYAAFSYAGPDPFTAEQAILMMADAVEASARSLKEYTEESIGELVDRIIDTQVAEGHFANCPITFQDIRTAKDVFKEKLKTIYHTRISYPKLHNSENAPVVPPAEGPGAETAAPRRNKPLGSAQNP